jgi:hypothetical protein
VSPEAQGTLDDAIDLFNQLKKGGTRIIDSTYPGELVEFAEGVRIGLRPVSSSGPATIDVFKNVPGLRELKFLPKGK